jgi:RNA 3'-terminal phosphate cyclase (ATP)
MIEIDGSLGEGGGQVLRSSLSLSVATDKPFHIANLRGKRHKPGLMRQHFTALLAAKEISGGHVTGAEIGSTDVTFAPGAVRAGHYRFSVGTAGSANLVLQTVLPILARAESSSQVVISGGTHNPASPPFDFLQEAYFPALRKMGYGISAKINRYGFYPAGGGEIEVEIAPLADAQVLHLERRGSEQWRSLEAVISNLSGSIAERELAEAGKILGVPEARRQITTRKSNGPGNLLIARIAFEALTAVFAQFGERNVPSEEVARRLCKAVKKFLAREAAVTPQLADQLLVPMALAKGGSFSMLRPSLHAQTNAQVLSEFLGPTVSFREDEMRGLTICEVG